MTNWIISANSQMYDHDSSFNDFLFIDWKQGKIHVAIGDIVFIYSTKPLSRIQYKCVVTAKDLYYPDIRDDQEYWKTDKEYQKSIKGKFMRLKLIDQTNNTKLSLENLKKNGLVAAPQGPIKVKPDLLQYLNSIFLGNYQTVFFPEELDGGSTQFEGVKKQIIVNKYERSSKARKKCIEYHGLNCNVCGLNFSEKYGEIGNEFIHVHHLTPIHTIGEAYKIDYQNDLIPVCPNCHAMIHKRKNPYTIQEIQEIMKNASR